MSGMSKWDEMIFRAWNQRNCGDDYHPPKAARIHERFAKNIRRVEVQLIAEGMAERYAHSSYKPFDRASDHATSYPSDSWQYAFWVDVAERIKTLLQEETKRWHSYHYSTRPPSTDRWPSLHAN